LGHHLILTVVGRVIVTDATFINPCIAPEYARTVHHTIVLRILVTDATGIGDTPVLGIEGIGASEDFLCIGDLVSVTILSTIRDAGLGLGRGGVEGDPSTGKGTFQFDEP
jgi:hypothetical protein